VDFSLVGNLEGVSERQSKEIREIAERYLDDGRYDVRMAASNVLARFGDDGSVRKLKKALATEPDVTVRARMQAALDQLDR
jgi:HEAT repeat protein